MWKGNTEDREKYTHGDTEMDQIVDPLLGGKASAHLHQGVKSGRRLRTSSVCTSWLNFFLSSRDRRLHTFSVSSAQKKDIGFLNQQICHLQLKKSL
jgi:hypothetical protein